MNKLSTEEQMECYYKIIEFITRPFDPLIINLPKLKNYKL